MSGTRGLEEEVRALALDVPYQAVEVEPVQQQKITAETKLIFLIFGACAGLFWQELLNCLPTIVRHLYTNEHDLASSVTSAFNSAVLIATIPLVLVDPLRRSLAATGAFILFIAPVLTGFICQYALRQTTWGYAAFLTIAILAGLASGVAESVTFAYAVCLDRIKLTAWFSMGFGVSGVLSYAYWVFTTEVLFSTDTPTGGAAAVWSQQVLAAVVGFAAVMAVLRLKYRPEYTAWATKRHVEGNVISSRSSSVRGIDDIAALEEVLPRESTTTSTTTGVSRPLLSGSNNLSPLSSAECRCVMSPVGAEASLLLTAKESESINIVEVAWQTAACQWHLCFILWISYLIMPNLVPLGLNLSTRAQDRLTGFYQICDFGGRYLANLPMMQLDKKWSGRLSHARLLLLGLAVMSFEYPDSVLSKSVAAQSLMVTIIGLSNGWLLTLFFMHLGEGLENDRKKGCATSISVMTQLVGVVAGLWFAALLRDGI